MPGDLRCLTLYPEHTELFRLGLRTIETRSRPTKHRGRIGLHAGMRDPDSVDARRDPISRAAMDAIPHGEPLTRGALVATAVLVDCVPILAHNQVPDKPGGFIENHESLTRPSGTLWRCVHRLDGGVDNLDRVEDQRQYGDFTSGRWAWLLQDIKPTTERCPVCWGEGRRLDGAPLAIGGGTLRAFSTCSVCSGAGRCDPIPARGKQGLWTWKPGVVEGDH